MDLLEMIQQKYIERDGIYLPSNQANIFRNPNQPKRVTCNNLHVNNSEWLFECNQNNIHAKIFFSNNNIPFFDEIINQKNPYFNQANGRFEFDYGINSTSITNYPNSRAIRLTCNIGGTNDEYKNDWEKIADESIINMIILYVTFSSYLI